MILYVRDFTEIPGGRSKMVSKFSGEEYRDEILIPKLNEAFKNDQKITIDLDGTFGYPTSFLDEAFGKLVKTFSEEKIKKIIFKSDDEPGLIDDIKKYMNNNKK